MTTKSNIVSCKYEHLYRPHDKSFVVNFGSKDLRPIRISLPTPPPLHTIDGWGLHPDEQVFKRLEFPQKLKILEDNVLKSFDKKDSANGNKILTKFWAEIENNQEYYEEEIKFIKKFIWHRWYGYWCYIDGKPTYISPWHFAFLNIYTITTPKGRIYPNFHEKNRLRHLFRHYVYRTKETFADLDEKGIAYKVEVDGELKYRMKQTNNRTLYGTIEPKGRREGLTNEAISINLEIAMAQRGGDKIITLVSMDGDNAEYHFKGKLLEAWKHIPLWLRPIWRGGHKFSDHIRFSADGYAELETLDTLVDFTPTASEKANDGKMSVSIFTDEIGKGTSRGSALNRHNINKETASLGNGTNIFGWLFCPSTVEQMAEGGQDYKNMADGSNFYQRMKNGQTSVGLVLMYFRSSFCLEGYVDKFGMPVLRMPTERQKRLGYTEDKGSELYIKEIRESLYDEKDPQKMILFRSQVRKFPEDYSECWTGIAGMLGFNNEKIRLAIKAVITKNETIRGEFEWESKSQFRVRFTESPNGRWELAEIPKRYDTNQVTAMNIFNPITGEEGIVNVPLSPKHIIGVDPQKFNVDSEAKKYIENVGTKQSDTGLVVLKGIDCLFKESEDHLTRDKKVVAAFKNKLRTAEELVYEVMKAAVYFGALVHAERNVDGLWETMIRLKYNGYLNYETTTLADGQIRRMDKPGTFLEATKKNRGFTLLRDHIENHILKEKILSLLQDLDSIGSMEQLTKYDLIAAMIQALIGSTSMYPLMFNELIDDSDNFDYIGATANYY